VCTEERNQERMQGRKFGKNEVFCGESQKSNKKKESKDEFIGKKKKEEKAKQVRIKKNNDIEE
jgi:hypothetical protein